MMRRFFVIISLMGILFASPAFAQAEKLQTSIFLTGVQQPIVMQDFSINDEQFYNASREGKSVKLFFRDLKEIRFLNPGKNYETEVLFNDGRKEAYSLEPASDITVFSHSNVVFLHHSKVSRIAFSPAPPVQPPQPPAPPAPKPAQPAAQPGGMDRVILKGGDTLSGQVQNPAFSVRTAYGTLQFETPKIASIEFDEKGPMTALVLLRNGDRLSGTVEAESVLFVIMPGQKIRFDGQTVKAIQFKR